MVVGVVVFLAVVVGIVAVIHGYLYVRLVRDTTSSRRLRRLGLAAITVLALLPLAALVLGRGLDRDAARWLAWPGYVWVGLMFYLLVTLLVLEPPRLLVGLALRRRARAAPAGPSAEREAPGAATAPDTAGDHASGSAGKRATDSAGHLAIDTAGDGATDSGGGLATDSAGHRVTDPADGQRISRRLVLARGTAAIAGAAAVGLVGYGMTSALGPPKVTGVTVPLRRLGAGLDGLRIAVVSDIHLGPTLGRRHTERVVSLINEARPDLVAIVGDLVDGTVDELGDDAAPLADLVSTHGSFFVTGNHEYYSGVEPWLAELERLGVRPLRNERVEIRAGGPGSTVLDLAGVNDVTGVEEGDGPDYERALGGRDTSRPVVLLAHQPVQVHQAATHGVDLQLSGHTHGGQLYPFHHLIRLDQPVVAGLSRFGDTQLYVTRGAGFWGPPIRVGAPPEITIVELTR